MIVPEKQIVSKFMFTLTKEFNSDGACKRDSKKYMFNLTKEFNIDGACKTDR